MKEKGKRFSKSLGITLFLHIIFAVGVSFFGYQLERQAENILEVNFISSNGGEINNNENLPAAATEVKEIIEAESDITDKKMPSVPKQQAVAKTNKVEKTQNVSASNGAGTSKSEGVKPGTGNNKSDYGGNSDVKSTPVVPPRILSSVNPKYPSDLRNNGIEGMVDVRMEVGTNGRIANAEVVTSSGYSQMDTAALKAVYQWKFAPAKDKFGQKVRCYVTQRISFNLRR